MDVRVTGHQVDMGEPLREHAADRMQDITGKYFNRTVATNVTFGPGPHGDFTCDIVAPVGGGIVLKAYNRAPEPRLAFEGAADKIEKQLRRYSKRLKEHRGEGADEVVQDAGYRILQPPVERIDVDAGPEAHDETVGATDNPPIVAETRVDIPEASVSDAVMLMDLRNTSALMFRNAVTRDYNMIYRREDGTIGWVEPNAR